MIVLLAKGWFADIKGHRSCMIPQKSNHRNKRIDFARRLTRCFFTVLNQCLSHFVRGPHFKLSLARQNNQREACSKTQQHNLEDGVSSLRSVSEFFPNINTPQRRDYCSSLSQAIRNGRACLSRSD